MRWSKAFIPTLRDDPAEADAPSHKLLLRAGYARQLMSGHYALTPLAVRVRAKIINIIRQEMTRIDAQEFLMPVMHPAEIWKRSGRWEVMGDEMFRLKDRKEQELALGMTHEEIFTEFFREVQSYRELPQSWYQFQTKLRDEPRPKSGLLRVREFTMKDAYSFDLDEAGLDKIFNAYHDAYTRIFKRVGIYAIPVEASNGAMGGKGSIEFTAPADIGEDIIVHCASCNYAANIEGAESTLVAIDDGKGLDAPEQFPTPGVRTIADLETFAGRTDSGEPLAAAADRQIKTLVYVLDGNITLVLVRGNDELVEQKLQDATGAVALRPAQADEIKAALGASPGSLGAVGVSGINIVADEALRGRRAMTTGANIDDVHYRGVDVERDITISQWTSLRRVRAGEACPNCGQPLNELRAVEVGHIFKLGRLYTEALDATVLGPEGETINPIMGCYGIGVERAMAVVIETNNDDKGIIWPAAVAPFDVAVVALTANDADTMSAAESLYAELQALGLDVLFDDRDARTGVKLADVELIGIPLRVALGKRGVANGTAEITTRKTGETIEVPLAQLAQAVADASARLLEEERPDLPA